MAKRTFKGLLQDVLGAVTTSPVPVKSVEYDPVSKRIRVEFDRAPVVAAPAAPSPPPAQEPPAPGGIVFEQPIKLIPGTTIPDDESPVDAMTLAAERPRYDLDPEMNGAAHGHRG